MMLDGYLDLKLKYTHDTLREDWFGSLKGLYIDS